MSPRLSPVNGLPWLWPALAFVGVSGPLPAQERPPGPFTAASSALGVNGSASPLALANYDPVASLQTDVFFGTNSAGPYPLSWKNAHAGTETVARNGVALHPDTGYQIDFAAGTISFPLPLQAGEMVRISYLCDTLNAMRNRVVQAVPLQWDIWQSGQNTLRFSSLYRLNPTPAAPQGSPDNGVTAYNALQFTGRSQLLPGVTGSTGLFLDLQDGDWMRRGGWQIAEQTRLANQQIGFTYARAGSLFAQSDTSGILAGRESLQANGEFTPLRQLTLNLFARQTTLLVSPGGVASDQTLSDVNGDVTREAGGVVSVALAYGGKVSAGRTDTEQHPVQGSASFSTHDTLQFVTPSIHNTQATVGVDTQTTSAATFTGLPNAVQAANYTQNTSVSVKSSPSKFVAVTGSFQNSLDHANPQDAARLTIEATPIPALNKLKVTASYEDRFQNSGAVRNRSALVDLPPFPVGQLHLSGGIQQSSSPGKELNAGLLNVTAKPLAYVEFTAATRIREGTLGASLPNPDAVNTYSASVALSPLKTLKFTGSFARNPETSDGSVQKLDRQAVGLQAQLGTLSLRGQYGIESDYINDRINNTADLGLDLRLTRWDTLTTGLKWQNVFAGALSGQTTYQLGFSHRFNSIFDLTLSSLLTTSAQDGHIDPDKTEVKAQAKLGLHF